MNLFLKYIYTYYVIAESRVFLGVAMPAFISNLMGIKIIGTAYEVVILPGFFES